MSECCPGGPCGPQIPRRDFLKLTAFVTVGGPLLAQAERIARYVPIEKGAVDPSLFAPGAREWRRGKELDFIGMPIGGICAGQVYLGGDGRLWLWDVFNEVKLGAVPKDIEYKGEKINALSGANYVDPPKQVHPFAQGFALEVDGKARSFEAGAWADIAFSGEYPMGFVEYRDPACPVQVDLEAYSPFCPLDADGSSLPAVVMRYTLRNTGARTVEAKIGGWMENPIGLRTVGPGEGNRLNRTFDGGVRFSLSGPLKGIEEPHVLPKAAIPFEDWAHGFGAWTVEGDAFGKGPIETGRTRLAKSFRTEGGETNLQSDARTGRLSSHEFRVERNYIEFWISGGNYPQTIYVGLLVDGKLVRSATGRQSDTLRLERFDVREFAGKTARLEIVDAERGFWGQVSAGAITFVDAPTDNLKDAPDFGDMALALLDAQPGDHVAHDLGEKPLATLFAERPDANGDGMVQADTPARPRSGVVRTLKLAPGESKTVSFAIAWRFPNLVLGVVGHVGHHYAQRFPTTFAVVERLRKDDGHAITRRWHETWYDSTLPRWFLDRTMANTSTLATMTCVRWADGRFYAWEGIGCCDGTCGHVWQYAQAVGRLFPELERSIREMADYKPGVGFEEGGLIDFRAEYNTGYAADAQAGYILRTLREHQTSPDGAFLKRVYLRMKEALEFLIREDGDEDGVLEGRQHNTLDVDLYGPSSWLSSLYLAALRAGEEMAKEMDDATFAKRCRTIFDRGAKDFDRVFWNGSYYIHRLNPANHPDGMRIGNGCEVDQLMGQWWAHQIGLGRIAGASRSKAALKALFQNNFLPDLATIRKVDPRGRWYGMPGESGLLMCSFPMGDRKLILGENPTWASMYFNEVWTGQEHQVAGHMISEGLVTEGMRVIKAVHDRHHPARRNPWNEVECSDHYARGMASYGAFVAVCGFELHGPRGYLGFAPKVGSNDFRAAFTAAEGWGTFRQRIDAAGMEAGVAVRHGSLRLSSFSVEIPSTLKGIVRVTMRGKELSTTTARQGGTTTLTLATEIRLKEGDELVVHVTK